MDNYRFIEEPAPPVTEDWESITSRLGGTWVYAPDEPCQQCERELDPMWARVSSVMGQHTCKEIEEGVWEHTFTPVQQRLFGSLEAAKVYLQPAIEQMEQKRAKWHNLLVEAFTGETTRGIRVMDSDVMCERCGGVKSLKEQMLLSFAGSPFIPCLCPPPPRLEEMSKPMDMMSYLRYCYDITIAIPPMRLRPLLAEGTPIRGWQRKVKARNRTRRQHRAAFRRRKRGLA